MNLKTKVFPEIQQFSQKPAKIFSTDFERLFVTYQGGFANPSGNTRTNVFRIILLDFWLKTQTRLLTHH